jgi:hypothetical protein
MMTTRFRTWGLLVTGLAAVTLLGGCREDEQGRPLRFQKGVYLGTPDTKLQDSQVAELGKRVEGQRLDAGKKAAK